MPASQEVIDAFVGAAHGDLAQVQMLLQQHPELLNARASWGETAIGAAAQTGQVDIAELLLAAGAPLDICTAAMLGRLETVAAMLPAEPRGANAVGAHDLPLLYHAAIRGHIELARLLLEHGAAVDGGAKPQAGRTTPLHGAAMFDQAEMARWLLAHGAHPRLPNGDGKTPLQVAESMGHEAVAAVLREAEMRDA
jgi:ankyrin repeat protein